MSDIVYRKLQDPDSGFPWTAEDGYTVHRRSDGRTLGRVWRNFSTPNGYYGAWRYKPADGSLSGASDSRRRAGNALLEVLGD